MFFFERSCATFQAHFCFELNKVSVMENAGNVYNKFYKEPVPLRSLAQLFYCA